MARFYALGTGYRTLTLESALRQNEQWDVFISHKSEDSTTATKIAEYLQLHQITAWVDVLDSNIEGDGPALAEYIESVLKQSRSLLVILSRDTQRSWWVPFEIGIAFELRKFLASYGSLAVRPSYMSRYPHVENPTDVKRWFEDGRYRPFSTLRQYRESIHSMWLKF